jgi:molecular chaperone Hsp33
MSDSLSPFIFENGLVRGAVVRLDSTWREVLNRRQYPAPVRKLLGDAMAACALLASTLKFKGSMILQAQAAHEAPVRLLVVECREESGGIGLRATAKLGDIGAGEAAQEAQPEGILSLSSLLGEGKLVITLDPEAGENAYQGVVPLEGGDIAQALENYMLRSEQLETRIWLAVSEQQACGLMLQRMPQAGGKGSVAAVIDQASAAEIWNDATILAQTIKQDELLQLDAATLLHRLFNEIDVRLFDARPTRFACTCTRERVSSMLKMLGQKEVESVLAQEGQVAVNCEFCHQAYAFDAIDCAQLFRADAAVGSIARH